MSDKTKNCERCQSKMVRDKHYSYKQWDERRFCSVSCKAIFYLPQNKFGLKGEDNPTWKGDNIKVGSIHDWIRYNYGSADRCENKKCVGKSKYFDWAKLRGVEYKRRRNHFVRLCRSCHRKYDKSNYEIVCE